MKGKNKCRILKEIRQRIADENDIPYVTRECSYQGECSGTCPKCEAELRYLEQELEKRRSLGKAVAVAAVAAGLSLSLAACTPRAGGAPSGSDLPGDIAAPTLPTVNPPISSSYPELEGEPTEALAGMIDTLPPETEEPLMGKVLPADSTEGEIAPDTTEEPELLGDVAYFPDTMPGEGLPADEVPEITEAPERR